MRGEIEWTAQGQWPRILDLNMRGTETVAQIQEGEREIYVVLVSRERYDDTIRVHRLVATIVRPFIK